MLKKLIPKETAESIYQINYDSLKNKGIEALIFDIDNTLVGADVEEPDDKLIDFFTFLKNQQFKICLISNNTETRVITFNKKLKIYAIHSALKPRKQAFMLAAKQMDTIQSKIAVIGDQLFTDIWGANRCKMYSILVNSIEGSENRFIKFKRLLERFILRKIK